MFLNVDYVALHSSIVMITQELKGVKSPCPPSSRSHIQLGKQTRKLIMIHMMINSIFQVHVKGQGESGMTALWITQYATLSYQAMFKICWVFLSSES